MKPMANAYAKAGVDVEAGYEVVERIKKHVRKTERLGVMGAIGGFRRLFRFIGLSIKRASPCFGDRWCRDEISSSNRSRQTRHDRNRLRSDVCQ